MKSVGIITFQWYDNYGTVLQAYGLQETVRELGCDARIVPLRIHERHGVFRILSKTFKGLCLNSRKYVIERILARHIKFMRFRDKYFRYLGNEKYFFEEAISRKWDEDALIFGSDNIWSPWCTSLDDVMGDLFYGSGIEHDRKIAYAASTAGYLRSHPRCDELLNRIQGAHFKSISLREQINVDLFNENGIKAEFAPDPTLLLPRKEWESVGKEPTGSDLSPYIFGYDLGHSGSIPIFEACSILAHAGKLAIKMPYPKHFWRDRRVACYPGPEEWLGWIRCSSGVVTNSFHGLIFSIIFNRPFVFVPIVGEDDSLNMRSQELLRFFGAENRILWDEKDLERLYAAPIDWELVNSKMRILANMGKAYLRKGLFS